MAAIPSLRQQLDELRLVGHLVLADQPGDRLLPLHLAHVVPRPANSEQERERAACRVQAVVALLEHDALRAVDHVGGHLEAAVRRQAVHEDRARRGQRHHRLVDREALERRDALLLVVLLPHRHPRVGVHGVGAVDRVVGRVPTAPTDAAPSSVEPLELGVVGVEARRAAEAQVHAEHRAHLAERAGDVVVVADVRDASCPARSPSSCCIVSASASACSGCDRSD